LPNGYTFGGGKQSIRKVQLDLVSLGRVEMKDRNDRIRTTLLALLISALLCLNAWAQSTASINGSVKDPSGAVLPGVEVTVTQTETGLKRSAVTTETGSYTLTNLPVGPYRLEAVLPGFRTYVQTGIVLQVNDNPVVNAVLEVGQVSETIEVQANAALVETRSTTIAQVIDNQRVLELPLNGRQVTELVLLSGVANVGGVNANNSGIRNYPTTTISIAGGAGNGIVYLLDGASHNDPYNNLGLPMPFPDALQEFKVESSAAPAQYGQHASGTVNAVTKSGTNDIHGDVFEFLRNGRLNARNAFALTRDDLRRNQFGGTLGGPIKRNKLFFFGGHQTTTERFTPPQDRQFIPTAKMMAGDFTDFAAPACNNGRQLALRAPVQNRGVRADGATIYQVDPALYSPPAIKLVTWNKDGLVFPSTTHPCGEIRFARRAQNTEHVTLGKVDWQKSEKNSLFFRYQEARRFTPNDLNPSNYLTLSIGNLGQQVFSAVVGNTYLIGAGMVSSFRLSAIRTQMQRTAPKVLDLSDIGVKNVFNPYPHFMRMVITNGFNWAVNIQPGHYNTLAEQISEDLSWVKGAHQWGFGANYIHTLLNANSGVNTNPTFTFSGQGQTGSGLADFLLGKPSQFAQGNENVGNGRQNYIGIYMQDTWKATPKLTLNYGVRWEPFLPGYEANNQTAHFDRAAFDAGIHSKVYVNAPAGLQYPPLRGTKGRSEDGRTNKYHDNAWWHFAPRLGLALDPNGDGRFTIRAAGGLFYDYAHLWTYSSQGTNSPFGNYLQINPTSFEDPYTSIGLVNPFPQFVSKNSTFPLYAAYNSYRTSMHAPYVYQWNLSLQKQIGRDWLVSANYLGNSTIHLLGDTEHNPAIYLGQTSTLQNTHQRRVLSLQNPREGQYFGYLEDVTDDGTQNYHGMLLSIQRRRSQGATVQGNYTWSHCIGDVGDSQPGIGTSAQYPGRRGYERGNCSGDLRHVVNVSTVYATPQFSSRMIRTLLSNWQISGLVRVQSATKTLTVTSGADTCLCGAQGRDRANQLLPNDQLYASKRTVDHWFNPAAFGRPADGQWGTGNVNYIGPGRIDINAAVTRKFQVRESQTIEFRAEAFNVPNHLNLDTPVTAINSPNFGKVLAARDPRIIQLALKYVF
jgi:outer membrane receptor protein involved in Fe transport